MMKRIALCIIVVVAGVGFYFSIYTISARYGVENFKNEAQSEADKLNAQGMQCWAEINLNKPEGYEILCN